jgi:serine-type D-Ala-D-Ala carboxypeptidase/endopeptidase
MGIVIGVIVLIVAAVVGYFAYKIKHLKDTHDLQARVDKICNKHISDGKSVGLLVGVVQGDKVWIQGYGVADKETKAKPDGNTLFEIGSISKVFTTEIAQLLVEQQQISWSDNITRYLPAGVKLPTDDNTTLQNLASHTSGFPRLPEQWFAKLEIDTCDPYSPLTIADLHHYLNNSTDKKKPSLKSYDYSNVGTGLLGHILEWKTGKTYETLLQEYIAGPLQMVNTSTIARDSGKLATGYDEKGRKTCHWQFPILPGAGAIISNGTDMVRFLSANMGAHPPLSTSFVNTQQKITDIHGGAVAYGWHIDKMNGALFGIPEMVWHNGGTGGFRSYIGFVPRKNRGIVVLANQATEEVDELALKLIVWVATISLK